MNYFERKIITPSRLIKFIEDNQLNQELLLFFLAIEEQFKECFGKNKLNREIIIPSETLVKSNGIVEISLGIQKLESLLQDCVQEGLITRYKFYEMKAVFAIDILREEGEVINEFFLSDIYKNLKYNHLNKLDFRTVYILDKKILIIGPKLKQLNHGLSCDILEKVLRSKTPKKTGFNIDFVIENNFDSIKHGDIDNYVGKERKKVADLIRKFNERNKEFFNQKTFFRFADSKSKARLVVINKVFLDNPELIE